MPARKTPSRSSTKKTSSRRQGPRRGARPKPFTVDHFRAYARNLILDTGDPWEPEDFQLEAVEDLFADVDEVWLVIPEGNGKTTLLAGVALYHGDYTPEAAVTMGAASRDQCEVLHSQAAGFVRRTPGLDRRFRVFDGYRRIRCLRTGGRIQVFAADDRTGDGVIPTLALLEELHRQRDLRLYRTWRGKLLKRGGKLAAISTAGEVDSEFEEIRKRVRTESPDIRVNGAHVRAAGDGMVLHDWAVPEGADVEDMAQVKAANPLSTITTKSLAAKRASPTMSLVHWTRFVANQAVQDEAAVFTESEWRDCEDPEAEIPDGTSGVTVAIDLGWKWDTTAIIPLLPEGEEIIQADPVIVIPPRDGTATDAEVIKDVLREMDERWVRPIRAVLDPESDGEQLAQWIASELGWEVVTHSQKPTPMALAAQRLAVAIAEKKLRHSGDPDLTRHILAAASKPVGEGWRLVKPKPKSTSSHGPKERVVIDGAVALAMGVSTIMASASEPFALWG